jgi:cytochrome d ubiquinol oxidase subunit I
VDALALARLQFAVTTIYHFLFVPLTIGLALTVAIMETIYVRTKNPAFKQMAQYWGRLFLINFAVGVVTGIIQEFQFGMNWSSYSRFVGDVFGAPLAIEALLAFFLESTFIGVWIFGWDRLRPAAHALAMWLVAFGTSISALWILTANSFMQEPTGYAIVHGRAEMTNFLQLIGNPQLWVEFPHVLLASFTTAAFFVAGVSAYFLLRRQHSEMFRSSMKIALTIGVAASILLAVNGDAQAKHVVRAQPMKMAAAEAVWNTTNGSAPWTVIAGIDQAAGKNTFALQIPGVLGFLSGTNHFQGINQLQRQDVKLYGPGNYVPPVAVTFWSFRIMVLAGGLMILLALYGIYLLARRRALEERRRYLRLMLWAIALPYIANTFGWLMTEIGRQPWIVYGLQKTLQGVSSTVSTGEVATTLIGFTVIFGLIAVAEVYLMVRYAKAGPEAHEPSPEQPLETAAVI